jgi:hypothetical protein
VGFTRAWLFFVFVFEHQNYGDNVYFSRAEALAKVATLVGEGFADYYCTLANKS